MIEPHLKPSYERAMHDSWKNDDEAHDLLALIVAEFNSDPMSVQCFDLRIVERAKVCVAKRVAHKKKGVIF